MRLIANGDYEANLLECSVPKDTDIVSIRRNSVNNPDPPITHSAVSA